MNLRERWETLAKRERYLLVATVVVATVAASRYVSGDMFRGFSFGSRDSRWAQVQKIDSYRKIAAGTAASEKDYKALEERYAKAQSRLLAGTTPTEVGAELQGLLSSLAGDAGLNVLSSQILREDEDGEFQRVGVRLSLNGGLEGVARLLSAIETGQVDLEVTLLEINRKLGATRRPVPGRRVTTPAISPLTATMEVKTYMQEPL